MGLRHCKVSTYILCFRVVAVEVMTVVVKMVRTCVLCVYYVGALATCNIFSSKPNKLKEHQAQDLSVITTVGIERMEKYCQDYIFGKESLKKSKKILKLHTFTTRSITSTEQNSRVKQLEEINRNALQALKASGITVQTSPYPLALATMSGSARTGSKSTMRPVLQKQPQFQACFINSHPTNFDNFCLITDFMCYIHMPPPSNTATYSEYFNYLWTISTNHNALS